jgi:protein-S-isoprenylcysteine O-methyltransferase Ste14
MSDSRLPALGPRGEGWVVAQAVVGAAIVVLGLVGPGWPSSVRLVLSVVGAVLAACGLALFVWGVASLGPSISPFPRPAEGASLLDHGAFRRVRHPIYGGILLLAAGWSLVRSPLALVASAGLAMVLELKSRHEEALLVATYRGYDEYCRRVRWRFVPGIH